MGWRIYPHWPIGYTNLSLYFKCIRVPDQFKLKKNSHRLELLAQSSNLHKIMARPARRIKNKMSHSYTLSNGLTVVHVH